MPRFSGNAAVRLMSVLACTGTDLVSGHVSFFLHLIMGLQCFYISSLNSSRNIFLRVSEKVCFTYNSCCQQLPFFFDPGLLLLISALLSDAALDNFVTAVTERTCHGIWRAEHLVSCTPHHFMQLLMLDISSPCIGHWPRWFVINYLAYEHVGCGEVGHLSSI